MSNSSNVDEKLGELLNVIKDSIEGNNTRGERVAPLATDRSCGHMGRICRG